MNVSLILIILLIGALATYSVGDKFASKVALLFGLVSLGASIVLLNHYNLGENIGFITQWIAKPNISFALQADGLALAMLLLTTALTPIIIFSSFGTEVKNAKTFYALILFMAFAMAGTFLATDGLLYYIFWELSLLPIYFIALVWGNGDTEERKKAVVKFFIYTLAGSLFMLVGFAYLYQKAGSLLIEDLYKLDLTGTYQLKNISSQRFLRSTATCGINGCCDLQQISSSTGSSVQWRIVKVPNAVFESYTITSLLNSKVVDADAAFTGTDGCKVHLCGRLSVAVPLRTNQEWRFEKLPNGNFRKLPGSLPLVWN